jgi:hypothetical protein
MNDENLKDLEREVAHYMAELSGMPMKFEAHLGRFVIHAAVLGQMYKLTDQEIASVVKYARKCNLVASEVPWASGKPN